MIIPYGARFRVENIMKINLYVTMIALSEIDFVSTDDFDLTGMEIDYVTPTMEVKHLYIFQIYLRIIKTT